MAKIKVLGDTIQIISELTTEQIKTCKKYAPHCLRLVDEGANEYFRIDLDDFSVINGFSIAFASTSSEGKAFASVANPVTDHSDKEKEKKLIAEQFTRVIMYLSLIENQVVNELTLIESDINRIIEQIEILD